MAHETRDGMGGHLPYPEEPQDVVDAVRAEVLGHLRCAEEGNAEEQTGSRNKGSRTIAVPATAYWDGQVHRWSCRYDHAHPSLPP